MHSPATKLKTPTIDQIVAMIAGLIATAKIVYDWQRDREAELPIITATCHRNSAGDMLLRLRIVRLERHDLTVHKIRGQGITFSAGRANNSGLWVAGEFFKELLLDWTVTSIVATVPSSMFPTSGVDVREIFVAGPDSESNMIEIKVLVSNASRRSRERWKSMKVKITH